MAQCSIIPAIAPAIRCVVTLFVGSSSYSSPGSAPILRTSKRGGQKPTRCFRFTYCLRSRSCLLYANVALAQQSAISTS